MNVKLKKAVEAAGSQCALAKAIGVKQQYIHNWLYRDKESPPAKYVLKIEKAVKGLVKRHELRPDIYPPEDFTRD